MRHEGHIRAGGVDKDVTFTDADHDINDEVDAVYRAKYRRYAASIIQAIASAGAASTTLTGEVLIRRHLGASRSAPATPA